MAALLIRLRLRLLWHSMTRSAWVIVSAVIGAFAIVGTLGGAALLLVLVRTGAPEIGPPALVLIGAGAVLVWMVGSLLFQSEDQLSPERFALLPVRSAKLASGLLAAATLGFGGILTAGWLVVSLIGWSVDVPAALLMTVLIPVALATCLLAAKTFSAALARAFANRRARDVTSILLMLLLVTAGVWIQFATQAAFVIGDDFDSIGQIVDIVATTPLGAVFGAPLAVIEGDWLLAGIRLAIALATVGVLAWIWQLQVRSRLTNPIQLRGGGTIKGGGFLERLFPATPAGAIAVRSLRYRRRDPRLIINALMLPFLPVFLMVFYGINDAMPIGALPYMALMLPFMLLAVSGMELAYDHANFATHMMIGVPGTADRAGRALANGVIALPMAVILPLAACAVFGTWEHAVPAVAAVVGSTLITLGVTSWLGVYLPGRAPKPGASPFGKGSSGGVQSFLQMLAGLFLAGLLMLPVIGLLVGSIWVPWLQWIALLVAVGGGAGVLALGIRFGGRALDRRAPEVLRDITSET